MAGIGIGDNGGVGHAAQRGDAVDHLGVAGDPGIRQAIGRCRHPVAGHIDEIEAARLLVNNPRPVTEAAALAIYRAAH